ncbi:putative deacylase [Methylophaga frappieri]|uniref:Putative deacylase n=1 Tax=Methylophaga frappieri (strain ATCC BAA-2434 / DSM 25690 / JAM7) TaxID=754477 RepID=I1YJD9_METFJ|nr:DUF2817 domain-containing protein [Methylophaga frappieri]AFJ03032.1 putative deacylase [Methylophaga frappieri]
MERFNSIAHPLRGPKNEKLYCDIAWAGNPKAKHVLVLVSGLHGVEGGVGSAIQSDFMGRHRRLPAEVCVILVHAINPWGFAWASRSDNDGIDINRNFVDFAAPLPDSVEALQVWAKLSQQDTADIGGQRALFDTLSQGQYQQRDALYFGGDKPSWSREVIEQLALQIKPEKRDSVVVIDIHSGLGPYGYGELICDHPPGSKATQTARNLFGATVTEPALGTSSSGMKYGLHDYFWHGQGEQVCFLTLEYGTFGNSEMLQVLYADHQLQQKGKVDWSDQATLDIKHALQDYFCPNETQWQELVLFRGRQVIEMALEGLTGQ